MPLDTFAPAAQPGLTKRARSTAKAVKIVRRVERCLQRSRVGETPFRHWLLDGVLPANCLAAIDALPAEPAEIGDTNGRRETHNATRLFFGVPARQEHTVCHDLATALQSQGVVTAIEALCGIKLRGTSLRIEYCLDRDGFWLEPHTDIGAKRFTMLIFLSEDAGCEAWGTDICGPDGAVVAVTPYRRNTGLIFVPGADTWHGFHRRPIAGVRRSLIVNYVGPEWRARGELAFPDRAVS